MKKGLFILLAVIILTSLVSLPVLAAGKDNPANDKPNNLYLYEKDSSWHVVWEGAWGKLNLKGNGGAFNGHGLEPDTSYELIKYVDPWPGVGSVSLGTGVADEEGNVHINADTGGLVYGDKVWLVLDSDFTTQMVGWNPEEYLFEHHLVGF